MPLWSISAVLKKMKGICKMFKKLLLVVLGVFGLVGSAFAQDPSFFTVPTVDATLIGTMVTAILAALALIWAARKAIKMINRS